MSNREQLNTIRATLQDLDALLGAIGGGVPSRNAVTLIGRGRAMFRAGDRLLAEALRDRVDGLADGAAPSSMATGAGL